MSSTNQLDDAHIADLLRTTSRRVEETIPRVGPPNVERFRRVRRIRRGVIATLGTAAGVLGLVIALTVASPTPTSEPLRMQPVLAINPRVNLGIVTAQQQVTVNLAHGYIHGRTSSLPLGAGPAYVLSRAGYVIGLGGADLGLSADQLVSLSPNLQQVLHRWGPSAGSYPAPANNPQDVWLTRSPFGATSAAEYDGRGVMVGQPISIPARSIVIGQSGPSLILEKSPTTQVLELWDPVSESGIASLGPWDQVASTSTQVVWTFGNTLHVDNPEGDPLRSVAGPSGDWVTAMSISPDASKAAVVWAPRPGSPGAVSFRSIARLSRLVLIDLKTGRSAVVPASIGASGPLAWTPDGSRLFFGQFNKQHSPGIATYALASSKAHRLELPGVKLPADFGPPVGSIYVWVESP